MTKKVYQIAFLLFVCTGSSFAQWAGSTNTVDPIYRNGSVGIGNSNPQAVLHVTSGGDEIAIFRHPTTANSRIVVGNATGQVNLGVGATTAHPYLWSNTDNFYIGNDGLPTIFVNGMGNGNVGIGTTTPQAKLAVNGNIFAKSIKVTLAGWPDYVFDSQFKLPSLAELEKYIRQHKHLPDVPSAAEVIKDGIDLGDNQATLLKKIEELTLYVIEQNKKLESQQQQIELLKKQVQQK